MNGQAISMITKTIKVLCQLHQAHNFTQRKWVGFRHNYHRCNQCNELGPIHDPSFHGGLPVCMKTTTSLRLSNLALWPVRRTMHFIRNHSASQGTTVDLSLSFPDQLTVSVSKLKLIQNNLSNRMGRERANGLKTLSINSQESHL